MEGTALLCGQEFQTICNLLSQLTLYKHLLYAALQGGAAVGGEVRWWWWWWEASFVFLGANGFSGSLFTFIVLFWGQECVRDAWEARGGGSAGECKVKNVQFETGLEGRRRRNLQMFSLSFFKWRSAYTQGMHRSSAYGLVNAAYVRTRVTASSWRQESTL